MIHVALLGLGYWGPNLARNLHAVEGLTLHTICDRDPRRLELLRATYPWAHAIPDPEQAIQDPAIDAVVIATPPATHYALADMALRRGKHVLVEKPFTMDSASARLLHELAKAHSLTLMVDHVFVYSEPVRTLKSILDAGEIGQLYYIDSVRVNLGLIQRDTNVLWDLAPHDLSILDHLLGRLPHRVTALGAAHADPHLEDVVYLHLDYGDGLIAHVHLNWLSPIKIRHTLLGGSARSVVYNDLDPVEPIKVYDCGVDVALTPEGRRGVLVNYRTGDVRSPHVPRCEALRSAVAHFAYCIRDGTTPLTDASHARRVIAVLEAAQQSLATDGQSVAVAPVTEGAKLPPVPGADPHPVDAVCPPRRIQAYHDNRCAPHGHPSANRSSQEPRGSSVHAP